VYTNLQSAVEVIRVYKITQFSCFSLNVRGEFADNRCYERDTVMRACSFLRSEYVKREHVISMDKFLKALIAHDAK